ncbi:major facilitator superfamily domain-containing protein [Lentinula boryana]|uniref:Major facilitator superfamily domain-containing protein n=1 Tax=Lentinula boryana TaxID=40481 RepID=A0ABQ8QL44_9AGAR|nr:major facilitator superfamily domain-containing protein [Lentinula boryana]
MSEAIHDTEKALETSSLSKIDDEGDGEEDLNATSVTEDELKRIQRKIDLRIMPWICLTYMFMRLNVNTVGNIAIVNTEQKHDIKTQLHLSPSQWAWVISCFYYTYMGIEPFSTLMMKKTSPSFWISRIMVSWGIVACCGAAVQNYGGLITVRTLLGATEGGFFPCILYYLAFWFRPEEITLRICFMLACSTFSGIISGFISYGVAFADDRGHLSGWRWLFIIEGLPPIILGLLTILVLPDYPDSKATAKFLTERERHIIKERLYDGAPEKSSRTWNTRQAIDVLWNPTFWSFAGIWVGNALGNPTPSFVLPTVIFELGFTNSNISNVLTVPTSVAIFFTLVTCAIMVRKDIWNPFCVAFVLQLINLICCIILMTVKQPIVRYIFILIARSASNTVVNILWPSRVAALRGTTAVGLGIALSNVLSNIDGLIGPLIFSTVYGPSYHVSYSICAGILSVGIVSIVVTGALVGRPVLRTSWFHCNSH